MKPNAPGRYLYAPLPTIMIRLAAIAPLLFAIATVAGCFGWDSIAHTSLARF